MTWTLYSFCVVAFSASVLAQDPCVCLDPFGSEDLHNPVFMEVAPGDTQRFYVGEQTGFVWIYYEDGSRNPEPFLNVSDRFDLVAYDERGLLGLTFHPDFEINRKFYAYFSETQQIPDRTLVAEFTTDAANPEVADMDSERLIISFDQPADRHNGGEVYCRTLIFVYACGPISDCFTVQRSCIFVAEEKK